MIDGINNNTMNKHSMYLVRIVKETQTQHYDTICKLYMKNSATINIQMLNHTQPN